MRTTCRRVSDGQTRKALQMEIFIMVVVEYQFIFPHRIRGRRGGSRSTVCVIRCEEGGF